MLLVGIDPDHHTFDILMMTCMKENRYEMANELFDKAVELSADRKRNMTIDAHLCNSALRVCTRASSKQLKRAETGEQLLQTISKVREVFVNTSRVLISSTLTIRFYESCTATICRTTRTPMLFSSPRTTALVPKTKRSRPSKICSARYILQPSYPPSSLQDLSRGLYV